MSDDAKFEVGKEAPVNIGAFDADELQILSALVQDAVFPMSEISWGKTKRRFALLVNRFRWEDEGRTRHAPERVQSVIIVDHVLGVSSMGIDRGEQDTVLSLMSMTFETGDDGTGHITLTLAGDGALRLRVEALEVGLRDMTRPYTASSGKTPDHGA